jgi:hypothetical protein
MSCFLFRLGKLYVCRVFDILEYMCIPNPILCVVQVIDQHKPHDPKMLLCSVFEIVNCMNTFENGKGKSFIPLKKDSFFGEGTICSHGKKIEPVAGVGRIRCRCRMPQPLSTLVSW